MPTDWPRLAALAALTAAAALALDEVAAARAVAGDYVQDYLSAGHLLAGRPVYASAVPDPARVPSFGPGKAVVNDHPPTYILALAPLGPLPYPIAFAALGAASVAAGGWAGWRVGREVGLSAPGRAAVAAAVLLHPGTAAGLKFGTVSLLLFAAMVAGWSAWRAGRLAAAGGWVGLAAAVKLFPGFVAVGFLASRRWRAVLAAGGVAVAAWGLTAAVVGPDQVLHYQRVRVPADAAAYAGHGFNLSLTGVFHRTFGRPCPASPWLGRADVNPPLATGLAVAAQLAVLTVVAVRLLGPAAPGSRTPDRAVALLVPGMLLLSPLTWLHAVPMLAVPVAVLARDALIRGARGRLAVIAGSTLLLWVNDFWLAQRLVAAGWEPVPWPGNLLLLLPTWGTVGLFALAATAPAGDRPGR